MFLFLFSLFGYRYETKVSLASPFTYRTPWKFGTGATFDFNITDLSETEFFIGLLTRTEINDFFITADPKSRYCTHSSQQPFGSRFHYVSPVINKKIRWNGTIAETTSLYSLFFTCSFSPSEFSLNISFQNPKTKLDLNEQPCIITKPIVAIFGSGLFVVWMIFWVIRFSVKNSIHNYLTVTYIFTLAYMFFNYLTFVHYDKSDLPSPLTTASIVFDFLQTTMLYTVMILVSKGWCLIQNDISIKDHIYAILVSIAASGTNLLMMNINFGRWDILIFVGYFTATVLLVYQIYSSASDTILSVYAHLYVIAQADIDPVTTPIYKKLSLFKNLAYGILIYFTFLMIGTVLIDVMETPFWVSQLIQDIFKLALLSFAGYIFRPRPEYARGYTQIEESGEELAEFTREDIQAVEADPHTRLHGTRVWEEGMTLPPQPIVVRNRNPPSNQNQNHQNQENPENENLETLEVQDITEGQAPTESIAPNTENTPNPYLNSELRISSTNEDQA